jgi:hypothetical protein
MVMGNITFIEVQEVQVQKVMWNTGPIQTKSISYIPINIHRICNQKRDY